MPNNTFRAQRKLLKSGDDSTNDRGDRVRAKRTRKLLNKGICVDLTYSTATSTEINLCKKKKRKDVLLSWEIPLCTATAKHLALQSAPLTASYTDWHRYCVLRANYQKLRHQIGVYLYKTN